MRRRASLALLTCVVVLAFVPTRGQGKRFITEKDLFKFTWIADPQISPDGATVAFVRVTVNEKENRYEASLFAVPASGGEAPRRLTSGIRDTTPRWSPDGQRLAFVRAVEKDGKTLAFNSSTGVDDANKSDDPKPSPERKSDVVVVTRAVYRTNGNPGYIDNTHHAHVFTIAVTETGAGSDPGTAPKQKQLTDGEFDERGMEWAPDGSKIYFVSTRVPEPYYDESAAELFAVPSGGGPITKVASIAGEISHLSVSPDGKRIAFVGTLRGNPIRSYSQPDLWVVDVPGSGPATSANRGVTPTPRNLTASYDFDIAGGIGGDQAAPRGGNRKPILWSKDGASLVVVSAEKGSANLKRVSIATGSVEPLTDGTQDVAAYSATPDASKIAATVSTQTNIGDIAIVDATPRPRAEGASASLAEARADRERAEAERLRPEGARKLRPSAPATQITHVNDDLFKGIQQSQPEEIWYRTFDGKSIQGWILKPPDFDASRKYPLILEIH